MKNKNILGWILGSVGVLLPLVSCMNEEPFTQEGDGGYLVKMNLNFSSALTRSSDDEIKNNCRFYISDEKGVLHKWVGLSNIPTQGVYLKYGRYLAQAWAGDSLPASFDSKYFKGETKFEVSGKQISTNVIVTCKIANVVVDVDASGLSAALRNNLNVKVESSQGSLEFTGETLDKKGYFMRYFDSDKGEYENTLVYTISGEDIDGMHFERKGIINNVKAAHEYKISLKNTSPENNSGGAAIQIQIREYEWEVEDTILIHGKPEFSWQDSSQELTSQLYSKDRDFQSYTLFIGAYDAFSSLILSTENEVLKNELGSSWVDLISSSIEIKNQLKEKGILIENFQSGLFEQYRLTLDSSWLNGLPSSSEQYVMTLEAKDNRGMFNSMQIRIANTEAALDAPFVVNTDYWNTHLLAIRAYSAKVAVNVYGEVENPKLFYHKTGDEIWQTVSLNLSKGENIVELKDIDENTDYELKVVSGDLTVDKYQFESDIVSFKTEGVFTIPNASMEEWYKNSKVWEPSLSSQPHSFWDTGNHGSTTLSENDNLTTQFTEYYHEGGSCAQLQSKFVGLIGNIGKHGAGNIFVGEYAGTSGTNGIINFGKKYNNSHPSKVRVWVNYRPGIADKGADNKYIPKGERDKGQIYIALSDKIINVNTGDSSTLVTEDRAEELFLAFGEKTFEGDFGADKTLEKVEIDFKYFEKANTIMPQYLIIVCCASKYGDYFSGGENSLMYVDDFELVYE